MQAGKSTTPDFAEPSVWPTMRIVTCNGETLFTRNDAAAAAFEVAFPAISNVTRAQAETILGWLHKASGAEVQAVLVAGVAGPVVNLQLGGSADPGAQRD